MGWLSGVEASNGLGSFPKVEVEVGCEFLRQAVEPWESMTLLCGGEHVCLGDGPCGCRRGNGRIACRVHEVVARVFVVYFLGGESRYCCTSSRLSDLCTSLDFPLT